MKIKNKKIAAGWFIGAVTVVSVAAAAIIRKRNRKYKMK